MTVTIIKIPYFYLITNYTMISELRVVDFIYSQLTVYIVFY